MFIEMYQPVLEEYNYGIVLFILVLAFTALYFSVTAILYFSVNYFTSKKWTKRIIKSAYFENQIRFEIKQSIYSIIVFAIYGTLTIFCFREGLLNISFFHDSMVLWDLLILVIWNEFHFYAGHRLMHTKGLVKFHRVHHKSLVVTPFSTYSFHPLEATIMGSVMIIPLLVYPFEIWALIIFPIYHLIFNAIGHSNVEFNFKPERTHHNTISTRHNAHHTKFSVNFGFVSSLLEWFTPQRKNAVQKPKK